MNMLLILLAVIAGGGWFLLITVVTAPTTKHGKPRMLFAAASALLAACLAVCGCKTTAPLDTGSRVHGSSLSTVLVWLGIEDSPQPAPLDADLLCDPSAGSTCTPETLRSTLAVLLPVVSARHSSTLRLWILGRQVADTSLVATVSMDAKVRSGKAEKASRERFVTESLNMLEAAAAPYFSQHSNRSPIAESISKFSLYRTRAGAERAIVIITDAKEFSGLGDLECHAPSPEAFIARLDANRVLAPESLAGSRVIFSYVNLGHIDGDRCAATLAAADQVQRIWEAALTHAGASEVRFEAGVPTLTEKGGVE